MSRRGFFGGSQDRFPGALIAARGLEAHLAEASRARNGGRGWSRRASRRSASAATRTRSAPARRRSTRSSASSPRRDAIRSTARRPTAPWSRAIADEVQGQAGERRPRRRLAGDPQERGARVHVADPRRSSPASPSFENCPRHRAEARASGRARSRSTRRCGSTSTAMAAALEGRRAGLLQQPEQPDGDGARRARPSTDFVRARPRGVARHGHPDRRGVSRLRDRSVVRDARFRWRSRRPTSSSRARSRRRTAWPACASATRSARPTR